MREKILTFIEKNSRINLKELAIMLGVDEASVANEIAAMEQENVICGYHTLIDWDKAGLDRGQSDTTARHGLRQDCRAYIQLS
mgnify:CR=1 FL=1